MNKINLFNRQIAEFVSAGWTIVSQTAESALLQAPRRWDWMALIGGIITIPIGIGFFLIGLAIGERFLTTPERVYLTADNVAAGKVPDFNEMGKLYYEKPSFWYWLFGLTAAVGLVMAIFLLVISAVGSG